MAFAKTGNPNHPGIESWPCCTPQEEYTMVFDKQTSVRCNFDAELMPVFAEYMGPVFFREREKQNVQH